MNAQITKQIGQNSVSLMWTLGHEQLTLGAPDDWWHSGEWRFNGYSKNTITVDTGTMFWQVMLLFHFMAERYKTITHRQPDNAQNITFSENVGTITAFPGWEMKMSINTIEFWLKLKMPKTTLIGRKDKGVRVIVWTNTAFDYINIFLNNVDNIPTLVKMLEEDANSVPVTIRVYDYDDDDDDDGVYQTETEPRFVEIYNDYDDVITNRVHEPILIDFSTLREVHVETPLYHSPEYSMWMDFFDKWYPTSRYPTRLPGTNDQLAIIPFEEYGSGYVYTCWAKLAYCLTVLIGGLE